MLRKLLLFTLLLMMVQSLRAQAPLQGKGMWIWKVWTADSGNLAAVVDKLKAIGVTWVVIKMADSDSYYNRNGQSLFGWASAYGAMEGVISTFHANGIKLLGYQYVYGIPHWGVGPAEYDVANAILDVRGIDGLLVDAEIEYDTLSTRTTTAQAYMDSIRVHHPDSYIALTSWARVGSHATFPWIQFLVKVNANMPQTYWAARPTSVSNELSLMSSDFTSSTQTWIGQGYPSAAKPILPLGQGEYFGYSNDVATGDVANFCALSQLTYAYQGVSLWEFTQITHSYVWNEYAAAWPVTSVSNPSQTPGAFDLVQNYPNPFNPSTKIVIECPRTAHVSLRVYDLLGRIVATLADEIVNPGSHEVLFDASSLPSGVYLYRLSADGQLSTRKMVVLR